ncbi:hypothetical protein EASAB2608_06515 [Streptomyces sp. EAS-AB2608]|nr:hypothetical protein EASAB2608_06515 [Streptomyces sp. EAS-AB2608]
MPWSHVIESSHEGCGVQSRWNDCGPWCRIPSSVGNNMTAVVATYRIACGRCLPAQGAAEDVVFLAVLPARGVGGDAGLVGLFGA